MSTGASVKIDILFDDNHCLVLNKPARLLTLSDESGDETLLARARAYQAVEKIIFDGGHFRRDIGGRSEVNR